MIIGIISVVIFWMFIVGTMMFCKIEALEKMIGKLTSRINNLEDQLEYIKLSTAVRNTLNKRATTLRQQKSDNIIKFEKIK